MNLKLAFMTLIIKLLDHQLYLQMDTTIPGLIVTMEPLTGQRAPLPYGFSVLQVKSTEELLTLQTELQPVLEAPQGIDVVVAQLLPLEKSLLLIKKPKTKNQVTNNQIYNFFELNIKI